MSFHFRKMWWLLASILFGNLINLIEAQSCSTPVTTPNLSLLPESASFSDGDTVSFQCSEGFSLIGAPSITCLNGTWSHEVPSCVMDCGDPGTPVDGSQMGSPSYLAYTTVTFECDPGFSLVGAPVITCLDGSWTLAIPTCSADCSDPGTPDQGSQVGNPSYLMGTTVTFECNEGYDLVGASIISCEGGSWSRNVPTCFANCVDPGTPDNGVQSGSYGNGGVLTFECIEGYSLLGASAITCSNGTWSNEVPTCEADCTDPGTPDNGVQSGTYGNGDTLSFECNFGYTLVGARNLTCRSGVYDGVVPSCFANCDDPGTPNFGSQSGTYGHGDVVTFSCIPGFQLLGAEQITCEGGSWSNDVPTCMANCTDPGTPKFGFQTGNYGNGEIVFFNCSDGYSLVGADQITCVNGDWSNSVPSCRADCTDPGTPLFGYQTGTYRHSDVLFFNCSEGYELIGAAQITCVDGSYSNSVPICQAISNPGTSASRVEDATTNVNEQVATTTADELVVTTEADKAAGTTDANAKVATTDTDERVATTDADEQAATTDADEQAATTDADEQAATTDADEQAATTDADEQAATTDADEQAATTDADEQAAITDADEQAATTDADEQAAITDADEQAATTDADEQAATTDADEQAATTDADERAATTDADKQAATTDDDDDERVATTDADERVATTDADEQAATTDADEQAATTDADEQDATTDVDEQDSTTNADKQVATTDANEQVATTDVDEQAPTTDADEQDSTTNVDEQDSTTDADEQDSTTDADEQVATTDADEQDSTTDEPFGESTTGFELTTIFQTEEPDEFTTDDETTSFMKPTESPDTTMSPRPTRPTMRPEPMFCPPLWLHVDGMHRRRYRDGDKVVFSCKPGYALVGPKWIVCFEGEWSGPVPECRRSCEYVPPAPRHGRRRVVPSGRNPWDDFNWEDIPPPVGHFPDYHPHYHPWNSPGGLGHWDIEDDILDHLFAEWLPPWSEDLLGAFLALRRGVITWEELFQVFLNGISPGDGDWPWNGGTPSSLPSIPWAEIFPILPDGIPLGNGDHMAWTELFQLFPNGLPFGEGRFPFLRPGEGNTEPESSDVRPPVNGGDEPVMPGNNGSDAMRPGNGGNGGLMNETGFNNSLPGLGWQGGLMPGSDGNSDGLIPNGERIPWEHLMQSFFEWLEAEQSRWPWNVDGNGQANEGGDDGVGDGMTPGDDSMLGVGTGEDGTTMPGANGNGDARPGGDTGVMPEEGGILPGDASEAPEDGREGNGEGMIPGNGGDGATLPGDRGDGDTVSGGETGDGSPLGVITGIVELVTGGLPTSGSVGIGALPWQQLFDLFPAGVPFADGEITMDQFRNVFPGALPGIGDSLPGIGSDITPQDGGDGSMVPAMGGDNGTTDSGVSGNAQMRPWTGLLQAGLQDLASGDLSSLETLLQGLSQGLPYGDDVIPWEVLIRMFQDRPSPGDGNENPQNPGNNGLVPWTGLVPIGFLDLGNGNLTWEDLYQRFPDGMPFGSGTTAWEVLFAMFPNGPPIRDNEEYPGESGTGGIVPWTGLVPTGFLNLGNGNLTWEDVYQKLPNGILLGNSTTAWETLFALFPNGPPIRDNWENPRESGNDGIDPWTGPVPNGFLNLGNGNLTWEDLYRRLPNGIPLGNGTAAWDVLFSLFPNGPPIRDNVEDTGESSNNGTGPWTGLVPTYFLNLGNGNLTWEELYQRFPNGLPLRNGTTAWEVLFALFPNGLPFDPDNSGQSGNDDVTPWTGPIPSGFLNFGNDSLTWEELYQSFPDGLPFGDAIIPWEVLFMMFPNGFPFGDGETDLGMDGITPWTGEVPTGFLNFGNVSLTWEQLYQLLPNGIPLGDQTIPWEVLFVMFPDGPPLQDGNLSGLISQLFPNGLPFGDGETDLGMDGITPWTGEVPTGFLNFGNVSLTWEQLYQLLPNGIPLGDRTIPWEVLFVMFPDGPPLQDGNQFQLISLLFQSGPQDDGQSNMPPGSSGNMGSPWEDLLEVILTWLPSAAGGLLPGGNPDGGNFGGPGLWPVEGGVWSGQIPTGLFDLGEGEVTWEQLMQLLPNGLPFGNGNIEWSSLFTLFPSGLMSGIESWPWSVAPLLPDNNGMPGGNIGEMTEDGNDQLGPLMQLLLENLWSGEILMDIISHFREGEIPWTQLASLFPNGISFGEINFTWEDLIILFDKPKPCVRFPFGEFVPIRPQYGSGTDAGSGDGSGAMQDGDDAEDMMSGSGSGSGMLPGDEGSSGFKPGKEEGSGAMPGNEGGSGAMPGNEGGNGTMPGDEGGSGAMPGDEKGSGTQPGNEGGSGAMPEDEEGSGATPGDEKGGGTEPGNEGGSGAMPGNEGGSGVMPGGGDSGMRPEMRPPAEGDMVYFSCLPGYELIGTPSLTCTCDGVWNGLPPMCREIMRPTMMPDSTEPFAEITTTDSDKYTTRGSLFEESTTNIPDIETTPLEVTILSDMKFSTTIFEVDEFTEGVTKKAESSTPDIGAESTTKPKDTIAEESTTKPEDTVTSSKLRSTSSPQKEPESTNRPKESTTSQQVELQPTAPSDATTGKQEELSTKSSDPCSSFPCDEKANSECVSDGEGSFVCRCLPLFFESDGTCTPSQSFSGRVRITQIDNEEAEFTDDLRDSSSETFRTMAANMETTIDSIYTSSTSSVADRYIGSTVTGFRNGSIVVDYIVHLEDTNTEEKVNATEIESAFEQSYMRIANSGSVNITVDVVASTVTDTDECASPDSHDCSNNATCINLEGSFTCECLQGYVDVSLETRPGRFCIVPEPSVCDTSSDIDCSPNATCYSTDTRPEGYSCQCLIGFVDRSPEIGTKPGRICEEFCPSSNCFNGGSCVNIYETGEQICSCPEGFTGAQCEEVEETGLSDTLILVISLTSVASLVIISVGLFLCFLFYHRQTKKNLKRLSLRSPARREVSRFIQDEEVWDPIIAETTSSDSRESLPGQPHQQDEYLRPGPTSGSKHPRSASDMGEDNLEFVDEDIESQARSITQAMSTLPEVERRMRKEVPSLGKYDYSLEPDYRDNFVRPYMAPETIPIDQYLQDPRRYSMYDDESRGYGYGRPSRSLPEPHHNGHRKIFQHDLRADRMYLPHDDDAGVTARSESYPMTDFSALRQSHHQTAQYPPASRVYMPASAPNGNQQGVPLPPPPPPPPPAPVHGIRFTH